MVFRQVVLAGVANYENDDRVLIEIVCDAQSSGEICACRSAAKDSLQSPKHARQIERFPIRDVDHLVDVLDVHVRRNNFLTDTFDEIRSSLDDLPGFFVRLEDRTVGIGADDPDARVLLL